MNLEEFKLQNPAYKDWSDDDLAPALHQKFYASMPQEEFYSQIGHKQGPSYSGFVADREADVQSYSQQTEKGKSTVYKPGDILRQTKNATPEDFTKTIQTPFAILENAPQMAASLGAPIAGGLGATANPTNPTEGAQNWQHQYHDKLVKHLTPFTTLGKQVAGAMTGVLSASGEVTGEGMANASANAIPIFDKLDPETQRTIQATAYAFGKAVPDLLMEIAGLRGVGKALDSRAAAKKKELERRQEEIDRQRNWGDTTKYQENLDLFPDADPTIPGVNFRGGKRGGIIDPKRLEEMQREFTETEARVEGQGELYSQYNPVDKFRMSDETGRGRDTPLNMDRQVDYSMWSESSKSGGAVEQSNFSADLFRRGEEMNVAPDMGVTIAPEFLAEARAALKPGFQRSATELMQARRFNENTDLKTFNPIEGIEKKLKVKNDDTELIKRAQEGDQRAFTDLFSIYSEKLTSSLERGGGTVRSRKKGASKSDYNIKRGMDRASAEDLAMEVMEAAFKDIKNFDPSKRSFYSYLYQLADWKTLNDYRHTRKRPTVEEWNPDVHENLRSASGDYANPEFQLQEKQAGSRLEQVMTKMPSEMREALEMVDIDGREPIDVARQLGVEPATFRKRLQRARELLQEEMKVEQDKRGNVKLYTADMGFQAALDAVDRIFNKAGFGKKANSPSDMIRNIASIDERNWDKVTPEEKAQWAKLPDLDSMTARLGVNFSSGSFSTMLTKDPRIKWLNDKVSTIIRDLDWQANGIKFGNDLIPTNWALTRLKLSKDPKAAMTLLKEVMTEKDKTALRDVAEIANQEGRMATPEELRRAGVSDTGVEAYANLQKGLRKAIESYNIVAIATKKKPIELREGYLPAMRKGDFKLDVFDKDGNHLYSDMADWKGLGIGDLRVGGLSKVKRMLEKEFPDHRIEIKELETAYDKNSYSINTLPFQQALEAGLVGRDTPLGKAVQGFMKDLRSKKNFGSHGIRREGIEGALGQRRGKSDKANNADWVEGIEMYFDQLHKSIANMKVEQEIGKFLDDPQMKGQWLKKYAKDLSDSAQGKYGNEIIDMVDAIISHTIIPTAMLGFSSKSGRGFVTGLGKFALMKFMGFWRPASLFVQKAQPYQFTPQMLAHYQLEGYSGNITRSIMNGEMELISPSPEFSAFIKDHAMPRSVIDPQLIHAFDLLAVGEKTRTKEIARWITGTKPLEMVEAFGRLETSAYAYHFFKDSGLRGRELYTAIERTVNDVMGDYTNLGRPQIYRKLGILGAAAGPLSTFHHLYVAQTLMYLKDLGQVGDKGLASMKPMALHLTNMFVWAGLLGMPMVALYDQIIDLFKQMHLIEPDVKNASEAILTSPKINNMAAFGPMSTATGWDLSTSLGAPSTNTGISSMMPALGVGQKLIEDTIVPQTRQMLYQIQEIAKKQGYKFDFDVTPPSRAERVKSLMTPAPNAFTGLLEKNQIDPNAAFSGQPMAQPVQPGQVGPDLNNRSLGGLRRDESDWIARELGFHTIKEKREMQAQRLTSQQTKQESKAKQKFIELATDIVMGEQSGPPVGELATHALKFGMTPDHFVQTLEKSIRDRHLEKTTRMYGISPDTLEKYRKYQQLQEVMKNGER